MKLFQFIQLPISREINLAFDVFWVPAEDAETADFIATMLFDERYHQGVLYTGEFIEFFDDLPF